MDDDEFKRWVRGVCLAAIRALKLPRWAEGVMNRALNLAPVGVLLGWAERLGLADANELRQLAHTVPDLPARLNTDQGQEAIRAWEAKHGVVPLLRVLRRMVEGTRSFWRRGGCPSQRACEGIGVLALSTLVPGVQRLRTRLADAVGGGDSPVDLMRRYGDLAMRDNPHQLEGMWEVNQDAPEEMNMKAFLTWLEQGGSVNPTVHWEIEPLPNNGGVYRVLLEGGQGG